MLPIVMFCNPALAVAKRGVTLMRKFLVGGLAGLALLAGCGETSTWVALRTPSGGLVRYYQIRHATLQKSKIGRSDGVLFMHGVANGPDLWRTNMKTSKNIRIYTIIGVSTSHAIAIQVGHGPYFKATSTGTKKP